jgi:murein DD-endopeptidase MepM/ murein hydrolase activator NlpD
MPLPRKFFESSARKLLSKYYLSANLPVHEFNPQKSDAELASDFQLINEKYRSLLQDEITALSAKSEEKRYFEGTFIRPLAAAPTSTFGEHRFYFITSGGSQVPAGESYHMGIDLAHVVNAEVGASNNGKVLFAGDLGIYGNTVILDHGFQLISLYGHLSSIACKVGDIKMKGEKLGTTGATGLAGGDHLHFEIRLYGIPVSPFEWLDSHWIQDRLNLPLKEVLQGR